MGIGPLRLRGGNRLASLNLQPYGSQNDGMPVTGDSVVVHNWLPPNTLGRVAPGDSAAVDCWNLYSTGLRVMPETRTESATKSDTKLAAKKPELGRPVEFTQDIADEICWRIAHGEPLVRICRDEHLPHVATIYRWLSRFPDFCDMYTKAKEDQADTLAEEIQDIADQMPMEKTDGNGNTSFDSAYIQWMRLRVDARKWVAAKLKPRKYGDRVELAGDKDNPIQIHAQVQAKEMFDALLTNMELQKQAAK